MLFKLKPIVFLLLFGKVFAHAQTQKLVLWHTDGHTSNIELYTKPHVTFEKDKILVTSLVLDMEYRAEDIVKFTYEGVKTGIDTRESSLDYTQENGQIVFNGVSDVNKIAVYKLNGIRVPVRLIQQGNRTILSLSSVPAGGYLLSVNNRTSKILVK